MIEFGVSEGLKLVAIDLDGTLLGEHQQISKENQIAVRRLQSAGAHVVLASGRHYHSMHRFAEMLEGVEWIVSCQGGELSDVSRGTVLSRSFLSRSQAQQALATGRSLGFTTVAYTVEGVFTDFEPDAELDFYAQLAGHVPVRIDSAEMAQRDIFKVILMGEPKRISALNVEIPALQKVRTHARYLEFMPADVSKGSALASLAAHLGISRLDAAALGDGENDIPMFEWAGHSVAMPHGWPAALARAKVIAPDGPQETAVARAVNLLLERVR